MGSGSIDLNELVHERVSGHQGRWSPLAPDREEVGEAGISGQETSVDPACMQTFTLLLKVSSLPPKVRTVLT